MNYEDARKFWIKEGYPACTEKSSTGSTSSTSVISDINRGDDWFCSRHKKDPTTGKRFIANEETQIVASKYLEYREKQSKGEFVLVRNKDALCMAIGKLDHLGRCYGFGGINVGYKKAFDKAPSRSSQSSQSGVSQEDRKAIKAQIREELQEEIDAIINATIK